MKKISKILSLVFAGLLLIGSGRLASTPSAYAASSSPGHRTAVQMQAIDTLPGSFLITPTSGLVTTEAGGTDTFTVRLSRQPSSPVKITLSSSDTSEGLVSPTSLTLNHGNWDHDQVVTVTGVDDQIEDGNIVYTIVTSVAQSSDPGFNGVNPPDVSVTNLDDDIGPLANNDSDITDEDVPVTTDVLANDLRVGGSIILSVVSGPSHGTTQVTSNNEITYSPGQNYNGTDQYHYQVCDTSSHCSTAAVSLSITPVNDPPLANPDTFSTNEDTSATVDLLTNDSDVEGDTLTLTSVTQSSHGSVEIVDSRHAKYTPNLNYSGPDSFSYTISDGHGGNASSNVSFTVVPVNDPPIANDDSITAIEDTPANIPVLNNDTDVDGDILYLESFDSISAQGGTLTRVENGTPGVTSDDQIKYTPAANFSGEDTFNYKVSDGKLSDSAVVIINVTANPQAPVANDDSYSLNINTSLDVPADSGLLANDINFEPTGLTAQLVSGPSHGTLSLNADGSFHYAPSMDYAGTDVFTYQSVGGGIASNTASVTLTINSMDRSPVAVDDVYSIGQDSTLSVAAPGLLTNDSDPDGNPLVATLYSEPAHGTVVLNPDGSFAYTPFTGYIGADSFQYQASDGAMPSNNATVQITVNDTQVPTVNWVSPVGVEQRFDVGNQTVTLEVDAKDNIGIASVDFFRWDAIQGQFVDIAVVNSPPFQTTLNTGTLNLAWNQIFAKAYDAAGNASERQFIWIYRDQGEYVIMLPFTVR